VNPIRSLRSRLKKTIQKMVQSEVNRAVEAALPLLPQLSAFQNSPADQRQSFYDHTKDPLGNFQLFVTLKNRLQDLGVPVEEVEIDIADFERWLKDFVELKDFYSKFQPPLIEKCMEHYLVYRHLNIAPGQSYVDVAASGSPWATLLRKRGIEAYRLDMDYPPGIHGIDIGADAGNTALPAGFASVLSAQCAYNCFMGDADIRFLKEASRLLRPNGRYGIVPLCLDETFFVTRSPFMIVNNFATDPGARCVWRDDEHRVHFSRHYSPEAFKERVYANLPNDMKGKVLFFKNLPDVMRYFPGQRIYGCFMFVAEKVQAG
jgi:hypothetical protein